MTKAVIVYWSPANPWWWGFHRNLWGYHVTFNGVKY
jgi:hypothetical protein